MLRMYNAANVVSVCVRAPVGREQGEGGGVTLTLDLGKGKIFTLSGVPGKGPFSVSTVHPFLLDGLFVENLEEIQAQARRIQVWVVVSVGRF